MAQVFMEKECHFWKHSVRIGASLFVIRLTSKHPHPHSQIEYTIECVTFFSRRIIRLALEHSEIWQNIFITNHLRFANNGNSTYVLPFKTVQHESNSWHFIRNKFFTRFQAQKSNVLLLLVLDRILEAHQNESVYRI